MPSKTFPPSGTRASKPFELIHSDLKSFPIESYRKYRYSIIFFDDFTSHVSGIDFRNLFFSVIFLTLHSPSLYFRLHRTQSQLSRPPDMARTLCSIPRNGLRTTSGHNSSTWSHTTASLGWYAGTTTSWPSVALGLHNDASYQQLGNCLCTQP